MLKQAAQIHMVHIPYRGGAQIANDVAGNQVELAMLIAASAAPFVQCKALKPIAVTGAQRLALLPDVPAAAETPAFKGFSVVSWAGVYAPAKTSPAVVAKLNREIDEMLKADAVRDKLAQAGRVGRWRHAGGVRVVHPAGPRAHRQGAAGDFAARVSPAMRPVWLDADPGFDDWLAMLMLAAHPRLRWLGISVVAGNAPLDVTLANTLRIRHHYGLKVPGLRRLRAAAGRRAGDRAARARAARHAHAPARRCPGADARPDGDDAVAAMLDALHGEREPVTLLAIGPLTNIAQRAAGASRGIVARIAELVLMGGSTERGNHTPAAEFNIHADPEAADIVFNAAGLKRRMFGLNLCRQVLLERAPRRRRCRPGPGRAPRGWPATWTRYQRMRSADGSVPMPLYDPVVAAWLWQPELFGFAAGPRRHRAAGPLHARHDGVRLPPRPRSGRRTPKSR